MVGGMSPDYVAKNEIKHSVGYSDNKKGVTGMLNYTHEFGANFDLAVSKVEENLVKNQEDSVGECEKYRYVDGYR